MVERNANEHVLAIALQENIQLSPIFFNFSYDIRIFLILRQDFLSKMDFPNKANVDIDQVRNSLGEKNRNVYLCMVY